MFLVKKSFSNNFSLIFCGEKFLFNLVRDLEKIVSDETILTHQTSSQSLGTLTVAKYAEKMEQKSRFLGVQFYNAVARNVKVIKCLPTDQTIFEKIDEWGENMGKETVRCIDTPGKFLNQNYF